MRNRERALETRFRFRRIRLWRQQRDFAGHAMDLGLPQSFWVVSTVVIASPMQRQASSNLPSSA
jgi:hypothetical protein